MRGAPRYLWDRIQQDAADGVGMADADFVVGDTDKRSCRLLPCILMQLLL